jgi:putative DNA primase/helicase
MTLASALKNAGDYRQCGTGYRIRCPAHSGGDFNVSVRTQDGEARFKCWSHGCDPSVIIAALEGRPPRAALELPDESEKPARVLDDAKRAEYVQRIWREARRAAGTLVETYLGMRGITIPIPSSLRFHPNLKHPSGVYLPAMVACVENADALVAIHRTFLKKDGSGKANVQPDKMMLGPCAGCAVRFARASETVAIAEGIETALSIAQACPHLAVWAALSASGIRALQLPESVLEVIICADNDPNGTGERAAEAAAMRFVNEGRKVRIAIPANASDFNDLLRI